MNDGQYQRGYRAPDVADPRVVAGSGRPGAVSMSLATCLDLAPGVEPERVGLGRELALDVAEREVLLVQDRVRERTGGRRPPGRAGPATMEFIGGW